MRETVSFRIAQIVLLDALYTTVSIRRSKKVRLCSKIPVIDAHSHLARTKDARALVENMNRYNIRLIVDLDGFWDQRFDRLPTEGNISAYYRFFKTKDEYWRPTLHGTGTEDYLCTAWDFPSGKYDGPYHGISLAAPCQAPTAWETPGTWGAGSFG